MSFIPAAVSVASPVLKGEATMNFPLAIAPAQVIRGSGLETTLEALIDRWGQRPWVVGGDRSLEQFQRHYPRLSDRLLGSSLPQGLTRPDCSESVLARLQTAAQTLAPDVIVGVGGGKALDMAKLLAHRLGLPIITVPTTAATCAAWTALSNLYSEDGAFRYDVALTQCPQGLVLDYDLVATAPRRTLVAGIGDALAKWYEASVSSGHSSQTLVIAALQQARVLRDILFQQAVSALAEPGGSPWREVVDATVLLAGVMGGLGGAQCRTVAAHAIHNGLTQLTGFPKSLHGEKVALGILAQLRLEEIVQGNQLAATSRQQLIQFYRVIGLPCQLEDLGLVGLSDQQLQMVAEFACLPQSDIHYLPFPVEPQQVIRALTTTLDS